MRFCAIELSTDLKLIRQSKTVEVCPTLASSSDAIGSQYHGRYGRGNTYDSDCLFMSFY